VSRIGRLPVIVPAGVQVKINGQQVHVKGPKGELERLFSTEIGIQLENGQILVTRGTDEPTVRALHGTTRALINNMVTGVSRGFDVLLDIEGVGYRAEMKGDNLVMYLGFSHPVEITPQQGIAFDVDTKTRQIKVSGYDKEMVGQVAAELREIRPPEPYKGKGIRYHGEKVRHKAGKAGKTKGSKK
jgi:large subunit ribosomal protein L6